MTRTVVRMLALHLGQGPQADLLTRQVPVRFPVVSSQAPSPFQKPRNEYEIEPQKGRGAHARIRTGDLFLTKEMLYRLSYVGGLQPQRLLEARDQSPDVGQDLCPAADLDGRGQLGELRDHHLARVQALGVMRPRVLAPRQAHDHDPVLEGL